MLAGESPEGEKRPQPTAPTVEEFLSSLPDVTSSVESYQKDQKDHFARELPTHLALAKKLALVGRDHIMSVLQSYPGKTMPHFNNLRHEDRVPVTKSISAVIFGIAYSAMDDFLISPDTNGQGEYIFDTAHFFVMFDNFMSGTGLEHRDAFDLEEKYEDTYSPHRLGNVLQEVRENGIASLFGFSKNYLLPKSICDLYAGLYGNPYVAPLARNFADVLALIESETDQQKRTDSITSSRLLEEQTPEQIERDNQLRRLLGITKDESVYDPSLDTPIPSNPSARWNDPVWFANLFEEKPKE